MHSAGLAKKQPVVRRHHGVEHRRIRSAGGGVLESVLQGGKPRVAGMRALDRLFELHLVAEKNEVLRASSHRDRVGQRHLPGFVDEKKIETRLPTPAG